MIEKICGKFWYIVGAIEGVLYSIKCVFQFLHWTRVWSKEHPTATDDMYSAYAANWWLERFPDVIDMV